LLLEETCCEITVQLRIEVDEKNTVPLLSLVAIVPVVVGDRRYDSPGC